MHLAGTLMHHLAIGRVENGSNTEQADLPISPRVARQAAEWFVLLGSTDASAKQMEAFQQWRASSAEHEKAWSRVERVSQRAGMLPSMIGAPVLRRENKVSRRQMVKTLALLVAVPPATMLAWHGIKNIGTECYATATGEQRDLTLADGTKIKLNTRSSIQVDYNAHTRLVMLQEGEILIETAPDHAPTRDGTSRPFIVQTSGGRARAIGTRFNVRQEGNASIVGVFEGAVELQPEKGALRKRLEAGQEGRFTALDIEHIGSLDPNGDMWAQGILAVHDMRLDAFVSELSRYRRGVIRCDPSIASLRISGAFQLANTERVLQNLIELLPVEVVFYTRYWTNIVAREKS